MPDIGREGMQARGQHFIDLLERFNSRSDFVDTIYVFMADGCSPHSERDTACGNVEVSAVSGAVLDLDDRVGGFLALWFGFAF